MNVGRERHAADIFDAVLDRDLGDRDEFLRRACEGDEPLRRDVESLMAADRAATSAYLAPRGSSDRWMAMAAAPTTLKPGVRIGRFVVRRIIAVGGMGAVYEAEQEHPRRTVALKVMRRGLASPDAVRRFDHECRTLARLRHPNIARIFDAGVHQDGAGCLPWFAMEHVAEARTIVQYAGERALPGRERLGLVMQVCDAVQHGHQRGILHRDIKPANILVDQAGEVTVIDFGIARTMDDEAGSTMRTAEGAFLGTVQYMSPEQLGPERHDVDVRCDVYAIGVVLYELLCGRPPHDLGGASIFEAARIVREVAPVRPSAVDGALGGDLETIVLKALEKDRARRYQSAAELRQDLERHLRGQPVAAQPPTGLYLLRLFARRNKALVAVAATALVLLAAAVLVVSVSALRLRRDAARRDDTNAFLESLFMTAEANPLWLDGQPAPRFGADTLLSEALDDAIVRLTARPLLDQEADATFRHRIGVVWNWMGRYDEAAAMLADAWERRRDLLGADHPDARASQSALAFAKVFQFDSYEAERLALDAHESLRRTLGPADPRTLDAMTTLLLACNYMGFVDDLERTAVEAVGIAGDDPALRSPRVIAKLFLAMAWQIHGRVDDADRIANEVIAELEPAHTATTTNGQAHIVVGIGALMRGDLERAEAEVRRGIELWNARTGPAMLEFPILLAEIIVRRGGRDEGLALMRDTLDAARRRHGESHPYTALVAGRALRVLDAAGAVDEAIELRRAIVAMWDAGGHVPLLHHPFVLRDLSRVLAGTGRMDEAYDAMRSAAERAERFPLDLWRRTVAGERAFFFIELASLCERLDRHDEALTWRARASADRARPAP